MPFSTVSFQTIFLHHPDALVLVQNKEITFINKRAESFGFGKGKSLQLSGILSNESQEKLFKLFSDSNQVNSETTVSFAVEGSYSKLLDYVQVSFFNTEQGPSFFLMFRSIAENEHSHAANVTRAEALSESNYIPSMNEKTYFLRLNGNYNLLSVNNHAESGIYEVTGIKDVIGKYFFELFALWIDEYRKLSLLKKFEEVRNGHVVIFEFEYIHQTRYHCLNIYIHPIIDEKSKKVVEYSVIAHDITHKKEFDRRIQEALKEKELLLKEIHHRVKNNLQMVSSLLNLQKNSTEDPHIITLLEENKARIMSLSIIHDHLYRSQNFLTIDFSGYLHSLVTNLIATFSSFYGKLDLKTDMDRVDLSIDQAIPCGLIVNELLTNSVKYAFEQREEGEIQLKVKELNNRVQIIISDNGVGLPEEIDIQRAETLGLQLVFMLTNQLGGEFQVERKNGTSFMVTFDRVF
jgi:two-component sensor histidine kinase